MFASEFDIYMGLQMSENDSLSLVDAQIASKLGDYYAVFFDEWNNQLE